MIGKEELKERTINIRVRDEAKEMGRLSIVDLLKLFDSHKPIKSKRRLELEAKSIPI